MTRKWPWIALLAVPAIALALPAYALPATMSLTPGRRPGLEALTIVQAAQRLRATGARGWALVEDARATVAERMRYSRRNSFAPAGVAFARGYGYCQQQAHALVSLLAQLGIEAKVVGALRNRFADGTVTGHAWVRVTLGGASRDVDTISYDAAAGRIGFTPVSRVFDYTPLFRVLAGWGCIAVNANRYYWSGKDA